MIKGLMDFLPFFFTLLCVLGGQLKTKNGQKYIISDPYERSSNSQNGFYISKRLAILIAALAIIVMLAYSILIYFLFAQR